MSIDLIWRNYIWYTVPLLIYWNLFCTNGMNKNKFTVYISNIKYCLKMLGRTKPVRPKIEIQAVNTEKSKNTPILSMQWNWQINKISRLNKPKLNWKHLMYTQETIGYMYFCVSECRPNQYWLVQQLTGTTDFKIVLERLLLIFIIT